MRTMEHLSRCDAFTDAIGAVLSFAGAALLSTRVSTYLTPLSQSTWQTPVK